MRADVHQHIWTCELLDRLAERTRPPLVRHSNGLTVLHSLAEAPYVIDPAAQDPAGRCADLARDGVDLAVVAISSPIGIEALPREEATVLIEAQLEGLGSLPDEFAAWGPVPLDQSDPDDVDHALAHGCVGISVPAGALAGPEQLAHVAPILDRVAAREVPLFVHPGRAPGQRPEPVSLLEPLWWRAMTDYVAQMQAAWFTFQTFARRDFPRLDVVFAMLAGGAPLLSERLVVRGGPPIDLHDPHTFYESSSYGPFALDALARLVGERQLVYGTDRPVAEPVANGRETALQLNAASLVASVGASV
jgi:predicted TIM-barrel fold metal-dependent hydrolase